MGYILVTGAAGYIGSAVTRLLLDHGHQVLALDDLRQGHRTAVAPEAVFLQYDLADEAALDNLLQRYQVNAVVHLAASCLVGESVKDPHLYFTNNLGCGLKLLGAMVRRSVGRMVFSSSAAVYGVPDRVPIPEDHPLRPVNPYGATKLAFEEALRWYGQAYGLQSVSLRYFNAAGALGPYGEDHRPETHLIPNIFKVALGLAPHLTIFGDDYPTPDGTAVRDYIHIEDIAGAHILALERLGKLPRLSYNIGLGKGFSVQEVATAAERVCGRPIKTLVGPRRPGDPPTLVADPSAARAEMRWQPRHPSLEAILESAWRWHREHPQGYLS